MKDRKFKATETQRKLVDRELEMYLEALCHDHQYAIRRACYLLELQALPRRLKRTEQLEELVKQLALRRETMGWGRPWTQEQIRRAFYSKARDFRRNPPKPVTREELNSYAPVFPPARKAPKAKAS